MAIWNVLRINGIFYDHLLHFVFIWYVHFHGFGIMRQEKSGNLHWLSNYCSIYKDVGHCHVVGNVTLQLIIEIHSVCHLFSNRIPPRRNSVLILKPSVGLLKVCSSCVPRVKSH
jgi:hypothetical protein